MKMEFTVIVIRVSVKVSFFVQSFRMLTITSPKSLHVFHNASKGMSFGISRLPGTS